MWSNTIYELADPYQTKLLSAKHESSAPMQVRLTSHSCIPYLPIADARVLVDTCGHNECSGKPCYSVSCDISGSCKSLVYTQHGPREDLNSLNIYPLYLILSFFCIPIRAVVLTPGGGVFCSTRIMVFAGTGFHYLAMNLYGTIVFNLTICPYMPPVIYRKSCQLVFGVGVH